MAGPSCSPEEHSHSDQPNYTLAAYLEMCRSGEAEFNVSEVARLMGVSRPHVYRMMSLSDVSEAEFETILDEIDEAGGSHSLTALADAVNRRLGRAKEYQDKCPNCGHVLRTRRR